MKFVQTDDASLVIKDNGYTVRFGEGSAKYCTAWTDGSLLTGCHFWQLRISLIPFSPRPRIGNYFCSAGVAQLGSSLTDEACSESWWIGVVGWEDGSHFFSDCGKCFTGWAPYQSTRTLGFCLQCEKRRLTVVDCDKNDVILTVDNVDVSMPVVPAVDFDGRFVQSASACLMTPDTVSLPSVLWTLL